MLIIKKNLFYHNSHILDIPIIPNQINHLRIKFNNVEERDAINLLTTLFSHSLGTGQPS